MQYKMERIIYEIVIAHLYGSTYDEWWCYSNIQSSDLIMALCTPASFSLKSKSSMDFHIMLFCLFRLERKAEKQRQLPWRWKYNLCFKCLKMTFHLQLWCSAWRRGGIYKLSIYQATLLALLYRDRHSQWKYGCFTRKFFLICHQFWTLLTKFICVITFIYAS